MFLEEIEELKRTIKDLEEENKKYLEAIIRHSKGEKRSFEPIIPS